MESLVGEIWKNQKDCANRKELSRRLRENDIQLDEEWDLFSQVVEQTLREAYNHIIMIGGYIDEDEREKMEKAVKSKISKGGCGKYQRIRKEYAAHQTDNTMKARAKRNFINRAWAMKRLLSTIADVPAPSV